MRHSTGRSNYCADYWKILQFINAFIYVAVPILTLTISNIWLLFIVFRKHLLQRSTILMVITVSAVFWLSWVWVLVSIFLRTIWISRMMLYMVLLNNWANPILYILTNESFKQYVTSINPFKFCCAKEVPNGPRKLDPTLPVIIPDLPGVESQIFGPQCTSKGIILKNNSE